MSAKVRANSAPADPARRRIRAGFLDRDGGQRERGQPDRDVDEEDPAPAQVLAEQPAEQWADRQGEGADGAPDADGGRALPALGEGRGDDRQGGRRDQGGPEALHGPADHQHVHVAGEPGGQRRRGEDRQPD
jgi:hypothetical protein